MDLAELQEIENELASLKQPATGEELTELEHQEATGMLVSRAIQNPNLFRETQEGIQLGKYKAIFVPWAPADSVGRNYIKIKFVRT